MANTLISTSDLQTCAANDSILTINDFGVNINIFPFVGSRCRITRQPCLPIPHIEGPASINSGGGKITAWIEYAEPFADIEECILTEESYFKCVNGMTEVKIVDPGQDNVKVGDAHKICEKDELYHFVEAAETAFGLDGEQLENVELFVDTFLELGDGDPNKLAYILGTINKESSFDSNYREGDSVSAWRNANPPHTDAERGTRLYDDYKSKSGINERVADAVNGKYYFGKGFIQLTWAHNYKDFSDIINDNFPVNVDMVDNPDLAFDPEYGAFIAVYGMMNGVFTGEKLDTYINENGQDFRAARSVVGGARDPDYITFTKNVLQEYENIIDTLPQEETPLNGLAEIINARDFYGKRRSEGKLIAVEGAQITCPNAIIELPGNII